MTGKEIKKGFKEIWELFKETDKRLDIRSKKTEEELEKTIKAVSDLIRNFRNIALYKLRCHIKILLQSCRREVLFSLA